MFKFINKLKNFYKTKLSSSTRLMLDLNALAPEANLPQKLDLSQARRVLVFAPHPDDECIGCGGALALLSQLEGVQISVVLVTNGDGGAHSPNPKMGPIRLLEMRNALKVLGISDLKAMSRLDGRFKIDSGFVQEALGLIEDFKPNWVFLPGPIDYHKDHLQISVGVELACRQFQELDQLIYFETWAPLPATHILDITSVMELKCEALRAHQTALKYGDYERGVRGLNAYRGLYLGFEYFAEAFVVHKKAELDSSADLVTCIKIMGLSLKQLLAKKSR